MLRATRRRAQIVAAALVVSLVSAFASESMPGHVDREHDAACLPMSSADHDEAEHLWRDTLASASGNEATHCLVCHWARSFRPLGPAAAQPAPVPERRSEVAALSLSGPVILTRGTLTLRAPPLTLLAS